MDYEIILKDLIKILNQNRIPYMLVGGIAVNYYGMPRPTFDVDVVVKLKDEDVDKFVKDLRRLNFSIPKEDVKQLLRISNRIIIKAPKIPYRVDIWFIKTEFDKIAFTRKKQKWAFNKKVWFISAEDLIISKLLVGRLQDKEDILGILKRQEGKLDFKYIDHWAKVLNRQVEWKESLKQLEG